MKMGAERISSFLLVLSIIQTLASSCLGNVQLSGCKDFVSDDDLVNRVTKKATLQAIEDLITKSKNFEKNKGLTCDEYTFPNFNINLKEFKHHAKLVERNGQILSDLLSSMPTSTIGRFRPVGSVNPLVELLNQSCATEANPHYGGNPILGSLTMSTLLSSKEVFAAGSCQGRKKGTPGDSAFCHYRHRDVNSFEPTGFDFGSFPVVAATWFAIPQQNAEAINRTWVETGNVDKAPVPTTIESVALGSRTTSRVAIGFSEKLWTDPYYDCQLGYIWMITYSTPIVRMTDSGHIEYAGMTAIDINLSDIDLDECSTEAPSGSSAFDAFQNTHLCEPVSTECKRVPNRGFTFGSYRCECRKGFYRSSDIGSDLSKSQQYYDGSQIENATAEIRNHAHCNCGNSSRCITDASKIRSVLEERFSCKRCPEGCDTCVTGREVCTVQNSAGMVATLSTFNILAILMSVSLSILVILRRETRVIRSASWPFLLTMLAGSVIATFGIMLDAFAGGYSDLKVTKGLCSANAWFYYIGFALAYGSILVKSWRLHQIFSTRRFRGKGRNRLSNFDLALLLSGIILIMVVILLFWTIGVPSEPKTYVTSSNLKYHLCERTFMDDVMEAATLIFLCPVVFLSFQLRNVADDFSETQEIQLSVYIYLVVKIIVLVATHVLTYTPDLAYLLRFLTVHFSFTLLIIIFFFRKLTKLSDSETDAKQATSFVISKKRTSMDQRQQSCMSMQLDDAHRRLSTGALDPAELAAASDSTPKTDAETVNYLPSLSEEAKDKAEPDEKKPPMVTQMTVDSMMDPSGEPPHTEV